MPDARPNLSPLAVVGGIALVLGLIVLLGNLGPAPATGQPGDADRSLSNAPVASARGSSASAPAEHPPADFEASSEPTARDDPMLVLAAEAGDLDTLRVLVAGGADVNAAEASGRTALMAASAAGEIPVVFALLDLGADPTRADAEGRTAADYAAVRTDDDGALLTRVLRDAIAARAGGG